MNGRSLDFETEPVSGGYISARRKTRAFIVERESDRRVDRQRPMRL